MAVTFTVTRVKQYVLGDRKEVLYDISCTGTPTVGGDSLTAATLGLDVELDSFHPMGAAAVAAGTTGAQVVAYHSSATPTSILITFLVQGTAGASNAMVPYTGATAGFVFRARAVGKGSVTV